MAEITFEATPAATGWNPYPAGSKEWYAHSVCAVYYNADYNKYLDCYYSYIGTPIPGADQSKTIAEQYRQLYPEQYQKADQTQTAKFPWLWIIGGVILAVIAFTGGFRK